MQKAQNETSTVPLAHLELWAEYWRNPDSGEALSRLVEVLLPLVRRVLERISITLPSHVATEDLMQAALIGLYYAINRFDPKQGCSFESFAYSRVRGAILDELRSMDHVSRSCRSQIKRIECFIRQWMHDYGDPPTEQQLAAGLGIELSELSSLLDRAQPWLSLDEVILHGDNGGTTLREYIADTQIASPDVEAQKEDFRRHLRKMFLKLTPREQKILYLYYFEELRLSEIAVLYKLTEARICQIHAFALAKLRVALGSMEVGNGLMSDGITKGELIPNSSEPVTENVYRVKPADADDSRNAREQFRDELEEKNKERPPEQKPHGKTIPGDTVPASRNWEAIHDDVILSSTAQQLVQLPAVALEKNAQEKPSSEDDPKPSHIHLTA